MHLCSNMFWHDCTGGLLFLLPVHHDFPWLVAMLGYKSRGIAAGGAVFCCLKAGNGCNGTEVLPQFNIVD